MEIVKVLGLLGICLCLAWAATEPKSDSSAPIVLPKSGKGGKNLTTGKPIELTLVDEEVRQVNWCVTGRDEPEMQYFPYNVFQPYLARTDTAKRRFRDNYGKVKYDYKLSLDEIKFSADDEHVYAATGGIGRGYPDYTPIGKMHNTVHLKFMAYKLRPYPLGVKVVRVPTLIEGLIIQVNQSPLGIGTATAQFMDPELDVICNDCRHPQGKPVGCRKRTRNDIVPPSIMVFHHKMAISQSFRDRSNPKPATPTGCLLCRELPLASGATGSPELCRCTRRLYDKSFDDSLLRDCSTKPVTQAEIKDCGPTEADDCPCYACLCQVIPPKPGVPASKPPPSTPPGSTPPETCQCNEYQRTTVPIQFHQCKKPTASAGLVPPVRKCNSGIGEPRCACTGPPEDEPEKACHPTPTPPPVPPVTVPATPPGPPGPPGQCVCIDSDPGLPEGTEECKAPTTATTTTLPSCEGKGTIPAGKKQPDDYRCRRRASVIYPDCVQDNTIPGCSQHEEYKAYLKTVKDSRVVGTTGEVHANLQWYFPPCLRSRAVEFMALIIHSFANQEFEIVFFGPYELPSLQTYPDVSQRVPSPYFHGYSKLYICDDPRQATTLFSNNDRVGRATYPFEYSYNYDQCIQHLSTSERDGGQFCPSPEAYLCDEEEEKKYSVVFDRRCNTTCDMTTLAPNATEKPTGITTPHGAINIITNFCVQPIAIFIGRYYKETLNRSSYRGMALWYWVHLIGSGVASVAMYIGYFHPVWVPRWHSHVIAGNTIMILLSLTYVSSWIRHTNKWLRVFAEFFHGSCGYCCSFIAYWCLHTVEVSLKAKILVYTATACLGAGYLVMEGCIFFFDRKFGMKPLRRHFPTVEARLGDLPVPGTNGRIFFLLLLTVVMLALCTVAAFS